VKKEKIIITANPSDDVLRNIFMKKMKVNTSSIKFIKQNLMEEIIIQKISEFTNIPVINIMSKSRKREYVYARCIIANYLRQDGLTFMKIGYILHRNHATILHYLKLHKKLCSDPEYIYSKIIGNPKIWAEINKNLYTEKIIQKIEWYEQEIKNLKDNLLRKD